MFHCYLVRILVGGYSTTASGKTEKRAKDNAQKEMALVLLKAMSNSTEWTAVGRRRVVARKGFSKLYLFITRAAVNLLGFK